MSIEQPMRGWHADPFDRFDERYFIDGRPTDRVRSNIGTHFRSFEDPMPGTLDLEMFEEDAPPLFRARAHRAAIIFAIIGGACLLYSFSIGALTHVTVGQGPAAVDCGTALAPATDLGAAGSAQCNAAGLTGHRTQAFVFGFVGLTLLVIAAIRALGTRPAAWVEAPDVNESWQGLTGEQAGAFVGTRTCPWCAESVRAAALICRFCGHYLAPPTRPEGEHEFVSFGGRPPGRPDDDAEERARWRGETPGGRDAPRALPRPDAADRDGE